ncbi:hypothetical protein [Puia sp.]|jgi:hypothetical protein|uniref:hypothetical protein n=1 Tax=Puia sp. TaxID=2045100 RepID=UPI002F413A06
MQAIEKIVGLLAGVIIGSAQVIYLINTVTRKVRPSVLSWIGWAFLMGTSVVSQVLGKGWQWSMTGVLCSTVGCLTIGVVALLTRNYALSRKDWQYVVWGLLCVGIYLLSNNPWITTVFAIFADAILGVPTIKKAWRDPMSERSLAWVLGVISSTLALAICVGHDLIYVLFPAYLFLFNGGMAYLTRLRPAG